MTKRTWLVGFILAAVLVALVGCGSSGGSSTSSTASQAVVLKAVTAWSQSVTDDTGFFYFQKQVDTAGQGQLSIKYLGGPEVTPVNQIVNALKSGTVDIALTSMSYESSLVPEANAFTVDLHTPEQERADGYYDLFNQILAQKANAVLLGRAVPDQQFNLYTTFPVHSFADFKGKPMRTVPNYTDILNALGASPVTLAPGDVYSALDRGVVQGYGWPGYGISALGWDAKTKYEIKPGFNQVDAVILINRDKWNSLTDAQKKILNDSAIDMEKAMESQFKQIVSADQAKLAKEGIKTIQLPADQFDTYLKTANTAKMNSIIKASPDFGPKIETLINQ
ncbi:MAG TPA: TRAP transporter substrate-binding protein DctP [Spirochaetia bacterium]|nr:TRAP transporter substrate-binding protein DctP [Spirochaetia bacterium]